MNDPKGVILIGGCNYNEGKSSNALIQLEGNSINSLRWTILQQKLKLSRSGHVAFSINGQSMLFTDN